MGVYVRYLVAIVMALMLVACENDGARDFVGIWYKISGRGSEYMSVEPHGDHLVVRRPQVLLPGEMETVPAKLEDRTLIIGGNADETDFWFDPKTKRLLSGSSQYTRSNH
jgi:hypothetical protein